MAPAAGDVPVHGVLHGIRVLELGGKGPTPFAGMMLADMGADVVAIDRGDSPPADDRAVLGRGKRRLRLDLRSADAQELLLAAMGDIDVIIEGFRPGVAERLGLGPATIHAANPAVVYGRMTGYGQGGDWSRVAGHDINFIAMSSALAHIGPREGPPIVPLNLVGDFGGGGMLLVVGVLGALVERASSGRGQVVDAAMTDGSAQLMAWAYAARGHGAWSDGRGGNVTDGSAPFYRAYETADGAYISVGALDPAHYGALMRICEIDPTADQYDRSGWRDLSTRLEALFRTRTRAEWVELFAGVDASFAPVLTADEAPQHPYSVERGSFIEVNGVVQPAPAPRFDRTPSRPDRSGPSDTRAILALLGADEARADDLIARGVAG